MEIKKVTVLVHRKYNMQVEYEIESIKDLEAIESELQAEDFERDMNAQNNQPSVNTPPESDPWDQPQDAAGGSNGSDPMCTMHKQVMDKRTRKGVPYHSFNGKNCSGQGWWPDRQASRGSEQPY